MVGVEGAWDADRAYRSSRRSPPVGHVAVLCTFKLNLGSWILVFKDSFIGFFYICYERKTHKKFLGKSISLTKMSV